MKKNIGKEKMLFAILAVAIIILASFAVITQFQLNDLVPSKEEKLSVKVFADTDEGVTPLTVNFSSIAYNYQGDLEYHWEFGDEITSNEKKPTHTYYHIEINESDDIESDQKSQKTTYVCKLTIEDEIGTKTTDQIVIDVIANRPPQISLKIPTSNPRRPFALLEFVPKSIRFDSYQSEDYWLLRNKSLLPKSFTSKDGFLTVSASATDPDGDEIVSYEWTLYPPSYNTRVGKPVDPEFKYTGQTVTIPIEDIYPAKPYNLKLVVTDSAGKASEENVQFTVQKSNQKSSIETFKGSIDLLRKDIWIDKFSGESAGKIRQALIVNLFYEKIIDKIDVPVFEALLTLLVMSSALNWVIIGPAELTQNLINSIPPIIEKYEFFGKLVNNTLNRVKNNFEELYQKTEWEIFNNLATRIGSLLETLGLNNKRPILKDAFPANNKDNIDRDTPYVQITVDDLHLDSDGNVPDGENNTFTVTINGDYIDKDVYIYENVTTGNFKAYFNTSSLPDNKLPPIEEINWNVKVVDFQGDVVEPENGFEFTTSLV